MLNISRRRDLVVLARHSLAKHSSEPSTYHLMTPYCLWTVKQQKWLPEKGKKSLYYTMNDSRKRQASVNENIKKTHKLRNERNQLSIGRVRKIGCLIQ